MSKMSELSKSDAPLITPNDFAEADRFVFDFLKRFSMMAAQSKAFLDVNWWPLEDSKLSGKPTGIFYSTGSQGGGQEPQLLRCLLVLSFVFQQNFFL